MKKISKKKINYSVKLAAIGDDEISVMKAYRDLTGLGLKEVKDKVNSAPCILLETNSWREAESYKTSLEKCGANVIISSDTTDITSQEADSSNKLKKIGIDFIILNIIVVFGGAAMIAGILHRLNEADFISIFVCMGIIFAVPCCLFNFSNNKHTDRMVAKTVKKNVIKHQFDKAYTFNTNNATIMIDTVGGRIAYVSNLNPWKFQLISAKNIDDIKSDYKKGILPNTTHYVYFQFSYQGKIIKIPTFTSNHYRPLEMERVQKGLKNAASYADILRAAKQVALKNDERM